MRTLILRVIGTTPLILHHIDKHQLREQIASHVSDGKTFEDEALEKMSKDGDGNPVVPVSWLLDAIRRGCSKIIIDGGKQLSFIKLQQSLHLQAGLIPLRSLNGRPLGWEVYAVVQHAAPGSKKMITVVAPIFEQWMLKISSIAEGDWPDNSLLQRIFREAGKQGIGLFHPPKKQFGQFTAFIMPSDPRFCQVMLGAVQSGALR